MDQIRYYVCYRQSNVKMVAVGTGYAYRPLGTSHHRTEDLGMLRTVPGLIVTAPSDPGEVEGLTNYFCNHDGPGYMRLRKNGEPLVYPLRPIFEVPQALSVLEGEETVVFSTGAMLYEAVSFARQQRPTWGRMSFPFVKPLDLAMVKKACLSYQTVVTIEEHQLAGGFESAVFEAINDLRTSEQHAVHPMVKRIGIPDAFSHESGSQKFLKQRMQIRM